MVRDFSQAKKEEIFRALDAIEGEEWKPFLEWCGGRAEEFGEWAERLGAASYTREGINCLGTRKIVRKQEKKDIVERQHFCIRHKIGI